MVKNIIIAVLILSFFVSGIVAGPERYDHLEKFKAKTVTEMGPSEEIVKNEKGEQIARAVYKYNSNKQISQINFFRNNSADGKNIFIYDENGLKQEELFNKENKLVEKVIYTRNKQGQVTEFEVFDANNISLLKWKFQYKNGKISSGARIIEKEVSERFSNEYTDNSIVQGIYVDHNENVASVVSYIENSRIIKRVKNDYTGSYSIEYLYDSRGRIEKMLFHRQDEKSKAILEKTHLFNYALPYNFKPLKLSVN